MLNITNTPFSTFGSYMALAYYDKNKSYQGIIANPKGNGLYLKSVKGKSRHCNGVIKFIPMINGQLEEYQIQYDFHQIKLYNDKFEIKICFESEDVLVLYAKGNGLSLILDTLPQTMYDYSFELENQNHKYYVVNSYKSQTKYFISSDHDIELRQEYASDMQGTLESHLIVNADEFYISIQDIPTHLNKKVNIEYNYEMIEQKAKKRFDDYVTLFKTTDEKYSKSYKEAIYTTWSATVKPQGLLKRSATYMSNTFFPGIWSWDQCFNTVGLMEADPILAYNNMMVVFDFQDENGQIPGSVNDSNIHWNFAKPPVQAIFIDKMLEKISLSDVQLNELFDKLNKQIHYWLNYHDCNEDGIPEYHHGNDSGFDNSTVFIDTFIVDSPDLSAYLIKGFEVLEKIGSKIGKNINILTKEKNELINRFIDTFVCDGNLVARETISRKIIKCDSILPYMSLVIAKYLPKDLTNNMVDTLKKDFMGEFGLSTEKTNSPYYDPDGYWRGPIWAPETVIIIDALLDMNEIDFAKELMIKFAELLNQNGFYENFNALTGKGLRDPAHTWTSSSFIYVLNKLEELSK